MDSNVPRKKKHFFNGGRHYDPSECDSAYSERTLYGEMSTDTTEYSNDAAMAHSSSYIDNRMPRTLSSPPPLLNLPPESPEEGAVGWSPQHSYSTPSPPHSSIYQESAPHFLAAPVPTYLPPGCSALDPTAFAVGIPAHLPIHHPAYPPSGLLSQTNMSGGMWAQGHPVANMTLMNELREEKLTKNKKKREQKCSLCKNHEQYVDVKGHKWFCPYRSCKCERCEITLGRQFHMKEQQKLTRSLNRSEK